MLARGLLVGHAGRYRPFGEWKYGRFCAMLVVSSIWSVIVNQVEEFKVKGDDLLRKIRELIAEGNVRKVTIKNADGRTMVEIPLTIGVVGALIAPVAAAIGAVAALVTECTITVTREEEDETSEDSGAE